MKTQDTTPIEQRLAQVRAEGRSALIPFCIAGHPSRESFVSTLQSIDAHADLIEIGVPFSDPVADGPLIADISRERARAGVHLAWLFESLESLPRPLGAPAILFSYLNPILSFGIEATLERMAASGFAGLVVPELPLEESQPLRQAAAARGLSLILLVTPLSSPARLRAIAEASRGFLYAVLRSGITGSPTDVTAALEFLRSVKSVSKLPVCAGFGLRSAEQVQILKHEVDGMIVGSALVEHLEAGRPAADFLRELHAASQL